MGFFGSSKKKEDENKEEALPTMLEDINLEERAQCKVRGR
jgi:hypothetical protein